MYFALIGIDSLSFAETNEISNHERLTAKPKPIKTKYPQENRKNYSLVCIGKCEYIKTRFYTESGWAVTYAHKGDCSNPIHKCCNKE